MKKNKISNDEKIRRLKIRNILWYLIIIFGILTVVLSVCSLVFKISPIYGLICFILEAFLTKYRNSIPLENKD